MYGGKGLAREGGGAGARRGRVRDRGGLEVLGVLEGGVLLTEEATFL